MQHWANAFTQSIQSDNIVAFESSTRGSKVAYASKDSNTCNSSGNK